MPLFNEDAAAGSHKASRSRRRRDPCFDLVAVIADASSSSASLEDAASLRPVFS
jgi:hypothetical protein